MLLKARDASGQELALALGRQESPVGLWIGTDFYPREIPVPAILPIKPLSGNRQDAAAAKRITMYLAGEVRRRRKPNGERT